MSITWAAQSGVSRPKISPGRERPTSPDRETQRAVFERKHSFGRKTPVKAGDEKSRETGSWRAKTPKPYLWHYGLGHLCRQPQSHSPEIGFSKNGLAHFSGIFWVPKSATLKFLRRAFEQPQVSPDRETIHLSPARRKLYSLPPGRECQSLPPGRHSIMGPWCVRTTGEHRNMSLSRPGDVASLSRPGERAHFHSKPI